MATYWNINKGIKDLEKVAWYFWIEFPDFGTENFVLIVIDLSCKYYKF